MWSWKRTRRGASLFPVLALSLISCVTATSLLISVLVYNLLPLDQLSRLFLAFPSSQGEEAALGVRGEGAGRKASHLRDPDIQTLLHLDLAFPPPAGTMEDTSLLLGKPRSSIWAGNRSAFPPQIFCYLLFCYQLSSLLDQSQSIQTCSCTFPKSSLSHMSRCNLSVSQLPIHSLT